MKVPTLDQAATAIEAVAGMGGSIGAAAALVGIVVDLFDSPRDKDTLKATYAQAKARTDAALDRLDSAIADRDAGG